MSHSGTRQADAELFKLFRQDGRQYLGLLRRCFAEAEGRDLSADERRNALRYAHSVKSEAAYLGYDQVAGLAHRLEDSLSASSSPPPEVLLRILAEVENAFDGALERAEEATQALQEEAQAPEEKERAEDVLSEVLRHRDRDLLVEARERGERLFVLECELTEHAQMLAPRRYLTVSNLEQVVNLVASYPEVDAESAERRFLALFTLDGDRSLVEQALDIDQVEIVRLEDADYEAILRSREESLTSGMIAGTRHVDVRMSTRAYEELCLYAGELHRQLDQLRRFLAKQDVSDQRVSGLLHTASRLAESVDDTVAETSMVPLAGLFSGLEQHARELAGFLDKSVRIITGGGAHKVFLPVSQVLGDLLLHLVRNAVDHGIESSGERRSAGKDPVATLRIASRVEGDALVVRVSDDGRGILSDDLEHVRGEGSSENALWDIVSKPGVTSRAGADRLSGRGIGLDVVRTRVERYLGGRVVLDTEPGRGTTISIRLPRASQLVSILIARHGKTEFALPSAHVFAVLDLEARFASRDRSGNLFYRYHGDAIRVYAVERSSIPATVEGLRGILMHIGRRRAIVLANDIVSQETVIRNTAEPDKVFSQSLNRDIGLVFPVQFL